MPEEQSKPAAPYLPFKTFLSSLEPFSQGIPPRIDRTIWRQSGLVQGLIMGAYRFFRLIDENDRPTELLYSLVNRKDDRPALVGGLLTASYAEIMSHNLTTMTMAMLDDSIERYNVSGSTKKKAITFFLQAAKYAGMKLSSFIQVRSTGGTRKKRSVRNNDDDVEDDDFTPAPQSGTEKTINLKSGGTLSLRVSVDFLSLSADDRTFVFELVDRISGYEKKSTAVGSK